MINLNFSREKYKDGDHTMAITKELLFVFIKLAILKLMAKLMTMMMINLILEVRYDKDGPMGEKTDRRVRIGDHQSQKIFISTNIYFKVASQWDNNNTSSYFAFLQLLFLEWAHPRNFYKKQPLWLIKRYFGDKVPNHVHHHRPRPRHNHHHRSCHCHQCHHIY